MSHVAVTDKESQQKLTPVQAIVLTLLRTVIGWHFLYEGLVKLFDPKWSAAGFLAESKWLLSDMFHWIASNPVALQMVDWLNIIGLLLIGMGLFLGVFTRIASVSGIALLSLYYVANPPLINLSSGGFTEGNYLFVDKNMVELFALLVLTIFPTGRYWGLDSLMRHLKRNKLRSIFSKSSGRDESANRGVPATLLQRRELLKSLATLPLLGGFVFAYLKKLSWESYEEKHLLAAADNSLNAITSATIKTFHFSSLKELKGTLPFGQIGNLRISRLVLGGNLIGGWAHARDLIYVSKLVKSYHTDQKVFDTLRLAEQCGVNTLLTNPQLSRVINEYWRKERGKIQFISDCGYKDDAIEGIKLSIDGGAHACYVQGQISDRLVREGKVDEIGKALDFIRQNRIPAGIGAHRLETVKACVEIGLKPDFWVKTLHHINYWSAQVENQHDNIWCVNPQETIEFMRKLEQPWIAFKVLAAGAISPEDGFSYAFKNGADFICVGMYDFQLVDDVNIALSTLSGNLQRERSWRA